MNNQMTLKLSLIFIITAAGFFAFGFYLAMAIVSGWITGQR